KRVIFYAVGGHLIWPNLCQIIWPPTLTDESQIKQVITNFEKAQHNRDYRTTMGIEGTEMMTRKYRDLWLKAGYDNQIVDAVKKGRYITEFGSIKWNNIVINKEKGTAKAEFILTGTIVSKDGKQLYSTYETNSVVNLIKEDGYWKVDDSNSK
ncbi:MAG: hypothetical protein K6T91_08420, partial [Firmicutes bacterium]|nr:hypothetical protein [Bacillota bacterium]